MQSTVGTAVTVPVSLVALVSSADGVTRMDSLVYNSAGMDLRWNFRTSAGIQTSTAFTPTTGGVHDWANLGDGLYSVELPATGGTVNNAAEGVGWISGQITGVLAFNGPQIEFVTDAEDEDSAPIGAKFHVRPDIAYNPAFTIRATVGATLQPTFSAYLATGNSRPSTTFYNQSILLPEGDDQVIHFAPKTDADDEDSDGFEWEFYIEETEDGNTSAVTLTEGDGITVLDETRPLIQVELPAITASRGYALVQVSPRRRTAAQGNLLTRRTAAVG